MAKKSSAETKTLKDSCVGTIKDLDGGGFTCFDKDGKQITCIPSTGTTSSCWVSTVTVNTNVLQALASAQVAIEAAIEEIVNPNSNQDYGSQYSNK